jgi:hypothetical protein
MQSQVQFVESANVLSREQCLQHSAGLGYIILAGSILIYSLDENNDRNTIVRLSERPSM